MYEISISILYFNGTMIQSAVLVIAGHTDIFPLKTMKRHNQTTKKREKNQRTYRKCNFTFVL